MRIRPWHVLVFIVLLALFSGWISLPGEALDVGGFKEQFPVRQGLDLQGGLQVVLQAEPVAGQEIDAQTLEGTRATLERRVNGLGVSEPLIQVRGDDQIIVELPGVDDPQEAVEVLQETALLEIIDPQGQYLPEGTFVNTNLGSAEQARAAAEGTPATGTPGAMAVASPGASPVATPVTEGTPPPTGTVYTTIVSGADLADALITTGNTVFGKVVEFRLLSDVVDIVLELNSQNLS